MLTPERIASRNAWNRQFRAKETAVGACLRKRNHFRSMVFSGADDQVENAVTVNICHRDVEISRISLERDDRGKDFVVPSVENAHLGRIGSRATWHDHCVAGYRRNDVDHRHESIVFMIKAMAVHYVKTGIVIESRADREADRAQ
jgi:hypothetical protein